jgi:hypothetical protein
MRDDEATIVRDLRPDRGKSVVVRAVVAHDADPVLVGLGANRLDLPVEELGRGVVRRHADGDRLRVSGGGPRNRIGDHRGDLEGGDGRLDGLATRERRA